MSRYVWELTEGSVEGPVVFRGYQTDHPVKDPEIGEMIGLPDGSLWRVILPIGNQDVPSQSILIVEHVEA